MRDRRRFRGLQGGGSRALRVGDPHRRPGAPAAGRHRERGAADRRGRGLHHRPRGAGRRRRAADAGLRRPGLPGGDPAQVPLPRPAPREAARQHHAPRGDHRFAAPADARGRVLRVPDPDPHRLLAGRRARLPGAVAPASGQVLRPAAGPAAVQAADDDRRLRPVLPDRAVLPRRGRPRRPLAGRVLPARHRDELRHPGRRLPGGGAGPALGVRGIRRRQARLAELRAHPLRRGDAEIRRRQAGPAQPARHRRRDAGIPARGRDLQRVQERHQGRRRGARRAGPGAASQPRSFFDKLNDWARSEGAPGLGYIVFEEEGGQLTGRGPIAKFVPAEAQAAIAAKAGLKAGDAVFFSAGPEAKAAGLPARPASASATSWPCPTRTSSPSAGSPTSRCTSGTRTRSGSISRTTRSRCRISTTTPSWPSTPRTTRRSSASRRSSTTSSATASNCRRARSATIAPR